MKIYIDDIRKAPEGWERASSVEAAIRMIATCPVPIEAISLDHDAGAEDRCPDSTFQPVAYFIGEKYVDKPASQVPKLFIHSANPSGEARLREILERYGLYAD